MGWYGEVWSLQSLDNGNGSRDVDCDSHKNKDDHFTIEYISGHLRTRDAIQYTDVWPV